MDIYGTAAVAVVKNYRLGNDLRQCWEYEVGLLTNKKSNIKKVCPRTVFLSLCETGYVKGIPKGKYARGHENKDYAIVGAKISLAHTEKIYQPEDLWLMIKESFPSRPDKYNQQMHVVLALKEAGFLQEPN